MANENKTVFNWQLYLGIVLVVTGGLFLADQLLPIRIMSYFWPLLIVLFGLTFFVALLFAGKHGAGLAIPGTVITTTGILLFVQNTFGLWVTWTYAWALLISATGLGMLFMNIYLKRIGLRRVAGLLIGIGLTLFVVFGVFFETILNIAGTGIYSGVFLGAGLVLLGLFVVFSRPLFARASKRAEQDAASGTETVDAAFENVDERPEPGMQSAQPLPEDADFSRLQFKSVGEVFLTQGKSCDLKMEGSEDLLKKVRVEVRDDELSITYKSDIGDWTGLQWINDEQRLRYYVTMKKVEGLHLAGAGSLIAEGIKGESLHLAHSGAGILTVNDMEYQELDTTLGGLGEIRLSGKVQKQTVDLSGAGSYHALELQSQDASVLISGAGSARVWAVEKLQAKVSGAGSIKYKGDPELDSSNTGLGSITRL